MLMVVWWAFTFYAEYNSAGRSGLDIKVDVIPVLVLDDNSDNASVITDNAGSGVATAERSARWFTSGCQYYRS